MRRILTVLASWNIPRRQFLVRCCKTVGLVLLQAKFRGTALAQPISIKPPFAFHPHYPEQTTIDKALPLMDPGLDIFRSEQEHEKVAGIFGAWSASLLQSELSTSVIEQALASGFKGSSWQPRDSNSLRPSMKALEVRRIHFSGPQLTADVFLADMKASLGTFSKLLTAEFQIVELNMGSEGLVTRVRYEFVGAGQGFHREQRTGHWVINWRPAASSYQMSRWESEEETRSRAMEPIYVETTQKAFGGNSSYNSQLLHGSDYWRTVLDGASGIDIYGHNGVTVGDIDGDGQDDIYVCQAAGLPNRLYRNRGDGTFEDITDVAGVGVLENTACALFADLRNSGKQDLVVVCADGPMLFLNEGNGKFRLRPEAFHFANPPQGTFTGAAAADYDRDGNLDIYFCLYVFYQGTDQYRYPTPYFDAENGPPNFLMRNNGDGTFNDVTAQTGLDKNNTRFSFCCGWSDYNRDGWPDLCVVNDFGKKNLYRNNGDGTFTDVAAAVGVEDTGAGMSVCWLDVNNEGAEDLYMGNMWTSSGERLVNDKEFQQAAPERSRAMYRKHAMGNSLLKNAASGFRDVSDVSGTRMGRWAWSSDAWDFDHDGLPDIYIANGMISGRLNKDLNSFFWRQVVAKSPDTAKSNSDYEKGWNAINEMIRADYSWSGLERNVLYANNGDGTFSDVSGAAGLDWVEDGRAFALADFDGDGRLEVLIKNRNSPQLRLMKNTVSGLPPSVSFLLQGNKSNRDGVGASVTIQTTAGKQTKYLQAGSGFLSQHTKEIFFGLGLSRGTISATVRWPSGSVDQLTDLHANHRIWVTEAVGVERSEPFNQYKVERASHDAVSGEQFPDIIGTWLLVPVMAPDIFFKDRKGRGRRLSEWRGKRLVLTFAGAANSVEPPENAITELIEIGTAEPENQESGAIYSLLFRSLFDRHRDLPLPTSFLIDEKGLVVKVCQGPVKLKDIESDAAKIPRSIDQRLSSGLPFRTLTNDFAFSRNYLSLGSIFFQRGYLDPAAGFFRSALVNDPDSAEALYGLGSVYLRHQQLEKAQESFEKAARSKARFTETMPNTWNNLGLLATRSGDFSKAGDYFQQAIALDPDHFVALENLGNAYRQQKRWEDARATLERALAIQPKDAEANYSLGMVFAQLDDSSRAHDYLERALQARPIYPEALNNLGVLYLRTHRRDEAVSSFERCIQTSPAFDQAYLNLARVYSIEGKAAQARTVLHVLLGQHPDHAAAQRALQELQ